ncbi:hypothetical protein CCAX7_62830 [Capsulimonas corticalis]|uniref:Uncharacterized protein n=1 Tax=Capsulimonas corticalis TaxID=2219043 RepID=A0A402CWR1_9BACT|nr:hypothetical protein CCAX7_62830 [Capsulimonas corticalis]
MLFQLILKDPGLHHGAHIRDPGVYVGLGDRDVVLPRLLVDQGVADQLLEYHWAGLAHGHIGDIRQGDVFAIDSRRCPGRAGPLCANGYGAPLGDEPVRNQGAGGRDGA